MVFRKPYGFLIKNFKLIHLIISAILAYIVIFSRRIYLFLNDCINDTVNRYNALEYIDYTIYIFILLVLGLFFVIYWLFKYKDKPRKLYIFSIFYYIAVGIFIFIIFNYFSGLPTNVLNQKTIRAYRDIMMIVLGIQYFIIINMFIRGLGFNIKKFDFGKDIHELNLSTEDVEEVEVDFNVDTTDVMRKVRKKRRELGYFFQEYRIIILGLFTIFLLIIGVNSFKFLRDTFKVYKQNEVIGYVNYVTVNNSYYEINGNDNYVIVKFDIFKYGKKERLNINNMVLMVGKKKYLPNKNICYKFNNVGSCYKKQYITDTSSTYILVYNVDDINSKKTYLLYNESYDDTFKVKLNLENYE